MTPNGMTEADTSFVNGTGNGTGTSHGTHQDMLQLTAAFQLVQDRLFKQLIAMGGFTWTMTSSNSQIDQIRLQNDTAKCTEILQTYCQWFGPANQSAVIYYVNGGDAMVQAERYVAEFLLTRGDFAWLGYGWIGCTDSFWPRPPQWDVDCEYQLPFLLHAAQLIGQHRA